MADIKWQSLPDGAPSDRQEVLIKCDDAYHVAVYIAEKRGFLLKGKAFHTAETCALFWMPIVFP